MKDALIVEGTHVQHPLKPEWGRGKVLAVTGKHLVVYFLGPEEDRDRQKKFLVGKHPLVPADIQCDTGFEQVVYDYKSGSAVTRRAKAAGRGSVGVLRSGAPVWPYDQALEAFLKQFPGSFSDPEYLSRERNYKWAAHESFLSTLGEGKLRELLDAGQIDEAAHRLLRVEGPTNFLFHTEKSALRDGLKAPGAAQDFATSLAALLEAGAPVKKHFEEMVGAMRRMAVTAKNKSPLKWPIVSLFPFLAAPEHFMYLKPDCTKAAAKRLDFSFQYQSEPGWMTYQQLHEMAHKLLDRLRPHGARDFIDVQGFIWVTACLEKNRY